MTEKSFINIQLNHAVASDVGLKRSENQDSYGIIKHDKIQVFLVADGMGGAQGGQIASHMAVELFEKAIIEKSSISKEIIEQIILDIHQTILNKSKDDLDLSGMGTTLVGLAYDGDKIVYFNVGDSRLYYVSDSKISQLTTDHTVVQELLSSGAISQEQAKNHPVSHMLTRSLGASAELRVDTFDYITNLAVGDKFLLCSDGLHGLVSQDEILGVLQADSINKAVESLVKLSNERGGKDNVTVMAVEISSEGQASQETEIKSTQDNQQFISKRKSFTIFGLLTAIAVVVLGMIFNESLQPPISESKPKASVTKRATTVATYKAVKEEKNKIPGTSTAVNTTIQVSTIAPETNKPAPVITIASVTPTAVTDLLSPKEEPKINEVESELEAANNSLQAHLEKQEKEALSLKVQQEYLSLSIEARQQQFEKLEQEVKNSEMQIEGLSQQLRVARLDQQKLNELKELYESLDSLSFAKELADYSDKIKNETQIYTDLTKDYLRIIEEKKLKDTDPVVEQRFRAILTERNQQLAKIKIIAMDELVKSQTLNNQEILSIETLIKEQEKLAASTSNLLKDLKSLDEQIKQSTDSEINLKKQQEIELRIQELNKQL